MTATPEPIATLRALVDAQRQKVLAEKTHEETHPSDRMYDITQDAAIDVGDVFRVACACTDFAALLRAFEELQFEVEKWRAATGMDDPIEFSQKSLSYIATMNKKLAEIEANLTGQPERT